MTFAVRGIPQHTFREMRFADLLFVAWRHRIPCFIEDGPQELDRRWIVCATIAHRVYSTSSPPIGINASLRPVECMTIEVSRALAVVDGNEPAERQVGGRRLDENSAAPARYQDGAATRRACLAID